MKKSFLLSVLIIGFPFLVSAGYSDDEYGSENYSDCDNEDKYDSKIEDPLLFDKIFLNQFKTEESRALLLAGFFSSIERMITEFSEKRSPYGPFGNKLLVATLCYPFWSKEALIKIISQVLDSSICSKDFQEKVMTQLIQLRDERANNNVVNETPELFYKEAVRKIISFYPSMLLENNEAGRLLDLSNYFDRVSSLLRSECNNDRLNISLSASTSFFRIYNNDSLSELVTNSLRSFFVDGDIQFLIKKLIKNKAAFFPNFQDKNASNLNSQEMKKLCEPMAQFCDQAIILILDVLTGSKCARYYQPVGEMLALLERST